MNIMLEDCRQPIKSVLLLVVFFLLLIIPIDVQAKEQGSVVATKELKELAEKIKAAENGLSNVKIESEAWVETKTDLSDPCEPWQRTPIYVSSTAWFDGHPGGKARVDVQKEILEWQEGAAPYAEESYSVGFNGQYGRFVRHSIGHSGKTFLAKEGRIIPESPKSLKAGWCHEFTGIHFTLNFYFSGRVLTFSDLFGGIDDPKTAVPAHFEFNWEEFEGAPCIMIASKGTKRFQESWWLDPSRGFALLGHDNISIREDGSERVSTRIRVTKLKEVTPGIWWPMEATHISSPLKSGDPYTRTVYHASNVVANDPNFADSIFTVPFPDGYLIDDQVAGKKYRAGEDPNASKS